MRQEKTNTWKDGLNLDLHPMVTPNTVLTDCLNGTFITYDGNEFCLQNNRGNTNTGAKLSSGYYPIGIKEHNGVLYIISYQENSNLVEIGTYPGLNWDAQEETEQNLDFSHYTPLKNLYTRFYYLEVDVEALHNAPGYLPGKENAFYGVLEGLYEFSQEEIDAFMSGTGRLLFNTGWERFQCELSIRDICINEISMGYDWMIEGIETSDSKSIFRTDKFKFNLSHPVTIEIQDSYDGSVNLVMTDGQNQPRIVNSGFSVLPNNKCKIIKRNQDNATNIYTDETIDNLTKLARNPVSFAYFDLESISSGGQLKGGNYTFYAKYGDSDGNQTDICAESGTVSIFKGSVDSPKTISGTLSDERTDKLVNLTLYDVDKSYDKIYLYAVREYSDTSGYLMTEAFAFEKPFDVVKSDLDESIYVCNIVISGIENIRSISVEDLNISYHAIDSTKTIAQQQDMLFLGNVSKQKYNYQDLSNFAKYIKTYLCRKDDTSEENNPDVLIPVSFKYENSGEYYDPQNIYYKVGYYPGEYYRFGIVFMFDDGSMSNVFNMCGGKFNDFTFGSSYMTTNYIDNTTESITEWNEYGVFRLPKEEVNTKIIKPSGIIPWHIHFDLSNMINQIQISDYYNRIVGYVIVRQKRIPEAITQGLQTGIEYYNHIPLSIIPSNLFDENFTSDSKAEYGTESFVTRFSTNNSDDAKILYIPETTDGQILADYHDYQVYRTIRIKSWQEGLTTQPRIRTYYAKMRYIDGTNGSVISILKNSGSDIEFRDGCTVWYDPRNASIQTSRITRNDDTRIADYTYNTAETNHILYNPPTYEGASLKTFLESNYTKDENYIRPNSSGYSFKDWVLTYGQNLFYPDASYKVRVDQNSSALLSLDPILVPETRNILNGSNVTVEAVDTISEFNIGGRHIDLTSTKYKYDPYNTNANAVFINSENRGKVMDSSIFSSIVGNVYDPSNYGYLGHYQTDEWRHDVIEQNYHDRVIRGLYTPYVGLNLPLHVGSHNLDLGNMGAIGSSIVNSEYYDNPALILQLSNRTDQTNAFAIRKNDNSEYYAVSNRMPLTTTNVSVYHGDCYTTTQTIRMIRNFIDSSAPYTETILKTDAWVWSNINPNDPNWDNINISDLNTVALGHWITFKCLSNYNIGLRSTDPFDVTETALMGNEKSFYPLVGSTATANKIEDSSLLNAGYSKNTGRKRFELEQDIPYIKSEYSNRVMFSNKNVTDQFINGYRTFQGLAYHDYDKQYGEIVKLLPWDNNLFCVFEHGCAILPINEKALMQTTTDQTIHIYGHGVLPDTITIISSDYGSKYPDSIIKTPIGIYGLDTNARKVWRYSKNNGFQTLSDMKIDTWLQDNIDNEYSIKMGILATNVRTEYDSLKGDVIFSISKSGVARSITFNERMNLWITRNSWYPSITENCNGIMYSIDGNCDIYKHSSNSNVTQWYNHQYPFEFEFVVSDPIGVHKIIDNLQIISNNCQPEELTFEIIGDSYMFNKNKLIHLARGNNPNIDVYTERRNDSDILNKNPDPNFPSTTTKENTKINTLKNFVLNKAKIAYFSGLNHAQDLIESATYNQDSRTKEYHLRIPQECRNIETWGRRIGNIYYSEDSWYTNVEPIRFDAELLSKNPSTMSGIIREARIRDKWCKIRVRYTGEDLAVISAIKTMINI